MERRSHVRLSAKRLGPLASLSSKRRHRLAFEALAARFVFSGGLDAVSMPVDSVIVPSTVPTEMAQESSLSEFSISSADLLISADPVLVDRQANLEVETDTQQDWGINLNAPSDFSAISAWVDLTKKFRRFGAPDTPWLAGNGGTGFSSFTDQGIPLQDFGAVWVHLGDPLGIYHFRYEGTATVTFHGDAKVVPGSVATVGSVTTMQVKISGNGNCWVSFRNVTAANPVRNLRMVADDLDIDTQEVFRPEFKARLAPFSTLRFMDWNLTNNSQVTSWSDRRLPTWTLQTEPAEGQGKIGGVAWEYMIQLANETGKDAWINIPHLATDDFDDPQSYVRQLATLWRDRLNPNLKLYVEWSNEPWNAIFSQFHQSPQGSGHDYSLEGNAASKIVRASRIFRDVFYGSPTGTMDDQGRTRLNINLAAFAANPWVAQQGIEYFTSHGLVAKDVIDSISIAPYIDAPRDKVYNTVDDIFAAIAQQSSGIAAHGQLAAQQGVQLLAYESGQHLAPVLIQDNAAQPQLETIMRAAQDDPRMGDAYREYVRLWQAAGGGLTNHFAFIDPGSRYGFWSLLTDPQSPGSVKWDAVLDTALRAGDATMDHQVTIDDFNHFRPYFGTVNRWWQQGDFNGDHAVDGSDLQAFYANATLSDADAQIVRAFASQHNVLLNEFAISLPQVPEGTVTVSIAAGPGIQVEPAQIVFANDSSALTPNGIKIRSLDSRVTQSIVSLTVFDAATGSTSTREVPVRVGNFSEILPLSGADTVRARDVYSIELGQPAPAIAPSVTSWIVDWGDGRIDEFAAFRPRWLHSYAAPGTYAVRVSLGTADGRLSDAATLTVNVIAAAPTPADIASHGLLGEVYAGTSFAETPSLVRVDPTIDFDFGSGGADPRVVGSDLFAIRWTGTITPDVATSYTFLTHTGQNDKLRLWINNDLVIDTFAAPAVDAQSTSLPLPSDQAIDVKLEYVAGIGPSKVTLRWETPTGLLQAVPSSVLLPASSPSSLNELLHERFYGVAGTGLESLYDHADYVANQPDTAQRFDSSALTISPGTAGASSAGEAGRFRGFIIPPESGSYQFALSGSAQASLRIGPSENASDLGIVALLDQPTAAGVFGPRSASVHLVAGKHYYVEILYRYLEAATANHLGVGWTKPSDSPAELSAIPISVTAPVLPKVTLAANSSETNEAEGFNRGASLVVSRSDDLGRDLTVYYVLGGSATNASDYRRLQGIVTIPAGSASAEVRVDPIDDNELEGPETVTVRLVAAADYVLGAESERRATVTIRGEAIAASSSPSNVSPVQLIPGSPNNLGGFDLAGQMATFGNTTHSDPGLPFTNAFTVQTTQSQYPFMVRRIWQDLAAASQQNDLLAVRFWARSLNADGSNASIGMRADKRSPNYDGVNGLFSVSSQWKEYHLAFRAPVAYAANDIKLELQFGYNGQAVEVGGVSFENYAQSMSLDDLNQLLDRSERYSNNEVGLENRTTSGDAGFATQSINDPSVPFTTLTRVAVNSFTNDYDVRVGWSNQTAIAQGDVMLASVYARTISPTSGPGRISLRLEQPSPPYVGEQAIFDVTSEWQQFIFPLVAPVDYGVGNARFDVRFGYFDQTIEIGGVQLLNFKNQVPLASLPQTVYSYGGRAQSGAWRDAATAQAYTHRNDPLALSLVGAPPGTAVTLQRISSEYKIGTAANYKYISATSGPLASTPDGSRYRSILLELFDQITDENAQQWSSWMEDPTRALEVAAWANANGLPVHGHSVIWGNLDGFPTPDQVRAQYETILGQQGAVAAADYLRAQVLSNIQTGALSTLNGTIVDSVDPIIKEWDVLNHPLLSTQFKDLLGQTFIESAILAARDIAHPQSEFFLNENLVLGRQFGEMSDAYYNLLSDYLNRGLPIDGAGFQSHFDSNQLPSIDSIVSKLARFASLGLELQATEFDLDSTFIDPQTQADFTRDFLLAMYANPNATATTFWGFWQGEHWRSEENAGLFATDWSVKPSGQVLLDSLVDEPRHYRTDAAGTVTATLPRGEYLVTFEYNGNPVVSRLSVDAGGTIAQIDAPIDPNVAPTDIVLGQTSINENTSTDSADVLFTQLAAVDLDDNDVHTFQLVSGAGDDDNADFQIVDNQLFIKQGRAIDYETKPTYRVRVSTMDSLGQTYEKVVTLNVNNLVEVSKSNISINQGANQRSRVTSVAIEFDSEVVLSDGAITVTKRGASGGAVGVIVKPRLDAQGRTVADLTFTGTFVEFGSLADGNYELRIDGNLVTNIAGHKLDADRDGTAGDSLVFGDATSDRFFRFFGDYDGDRDTDTTDYLFFRRAFLQAAPSPLYQSLFDYDSDGDVDTIDYLFFRRRFGQRLAE